MTSHTLLELSESTRHACRLASTAEVAVLKKLHVTQGSCGSAWMGLHVVGCQVLFFLWSSPENQRGIQTATYTSQIIRIHVEIRHKYQCTIISFKTRTYVQHSLSLSHTHVTAEPML